MTGALASIVLAFLLGVLSLLLVLYRVSPLTAPEFALPFFFLSILTLTSALAALILSLTKSFLAHQPLRSRVFISSSLRQGIFLGIATCIVLFLHLLHILNWWIAGLVYAVFILIELAVGR